MFSPGVWWCILSQEWKDALWDNQKTMAKWRKRDVVRLAVKAQPKRETDVTRHAAGQMQGLVRRATRKVFMAQSNTGSLRPSLYLVASIPECNLPA
jgi:hypothetical protein